MKYDWGVQTIIDGQLGAIHWIKDEAEARDTVKRFPTAYRLMRRRSVGDWEIVAEGDSPEPDSAVDLILAEMKEVNVWLRRIAGRM